MARKILTIGITAIAIIISSLTACDKKSTSKTAELETSHAPGNLAKTLVDNNEFIDVDVTSIIKALQHANATASRLSSNDEMQEAKMRAATYRFYSHVKLVDDHYILDLKSPKEINVSQQVYDALLNNLTEMNEFIDKNKDKNDSTEWIIPEITEEYLQSLLN